MTKPAEALVHNPPIDRGKNMNPKNRQWTLARRPQGMLQEEDFAYRETTISGRMGSQLIMPLMAAQEARGLPVL